MAKLKGRPADAPFKIPKTQKSGALVDAAFPFGRRGRIGRAALGDTHHGRAQHALADGKAFLHDLHDSALRHGSVRHFKHGLVLVRVKLLPGCFDLLHIGHITLLEEARRFGDRLVVGLNSDSSVRALKGPSRPIVGERERARVLAALAAVDAVVAFAETTPLALIEALRPDVLVKGGDYATDEIVGAQQVVAWGGQVRIVPIVAGFSTSTLLARSASA